MQKNITASPPKEIIERLIQLESNGQHAALAEATGKVLEHYPYCPVVWNLLGVAKGHEGQFSDAIKAFEEALKFKPDFVDALNNLGTTYRSADNRSAAKIAYERALSLRPRSYVTLTNLGTLFVDSGEPDQAIDTFNKALEINPAYSVALYNLGNVLRERGEFETARTLYKKALFSAPEMGQAHHNLGIAHMELDCLDEALDSFNSALLCQFKTADLYNSIGIALRKKGLLTESIGAIKLGLQKRHYCPELTFNLALSHLTAGDFVTGFEYYEARFFQKGRSLRIPRKNFLWDGKKSLKGKTFLVYEEQGFGDTFQFSRFLKILQEKGAKVYFKVNKKLHALLSCLDDTITLISEDSEIDSVDFECSLLSLPRLLSLQLDTIPVLDAYLFADEERRLNWSETLPDNGLKVGISWQGTKSDIDKGRSFPLAKFSKISQTPYVQLISLQKGLGEEQLDEINFEVTHFSGRLDSEDEAFSDTAAVMMNCDLIITSDTSIAHLAGALGRPTWVILQKVPEWRWLLDRDDTPWYPQTRLYRQKEFGDWDSVFSEVQKNLEQLVRRAGFNLAG